MGIDNVWLWRADHCTVRPCPARDCNTALVVNGKNVTAYGVAAEHTQKDVIVWNGGGGETFFFQSEMDSFAHEEQDRTPNYGADVCGYRVNAKEHRAWGAGVYDYFELPGVKVRAGICTQYPSALAGFICPFKWDLNSRWFAHRESTIEVAAA